MHIIFLLSLILMFSCHKEEAKCWECSIITISNEVSICTDPEQITELDPTETEIICDQREKEAYIDSRQVTSEKIEKECPDAVRYFVVSKSPVCVLQP